MKVYAIKNKEGKYFAVSSSNYEHYWTTIDFAHYFTFLNETYDAKQEAEEYRNRKYPDCEVVEITIAEGNLLQKIGELKDYIYSYNNETNNRPQTCNEYIDATCKDILAKMKELEL